MVDNDVRGVALAGGCDLTILFTHACRHQIDPQIAIAGTAGTLRMGADGRDIVLRDATGAEIARETITADRHTPMARDLAAWIRGVPGAAVYATLEQAEAHLIICNGASEATAIRDVPDAYVNETLDTFTAPDATVVVRDPVLNLLRSASVSISDGAATFVGDLSETLSCAALNADISLVKGGKAIIGRPKDRVAAFLAE